ncbi:ABC transporter permease subunit [Halosimplex halophilum]|uniref:ABC transporter permease subunit n=1 Tax=Halosimplex halophilum TaxID=2559572 RepID=UPI00107F41B2|nr:ABC transporter permease subunit [Halosimplex halophilum]
MATNALTVARDDFLNAARSHVVLGVVGAFVVSVALVFLAEMDLFADPYRTLNDVALLFILVGPVLLAPLSYLAVAGDRASGRLKYVMGLPASRPGYVAAKVASRAGVAVAAVLASLAVGFAVALAAFENAPDPAAFALFAVASALYVATFVCIFVAISASVTGRSRAMFGAVAVYFVLVPFWLGVTPPLTLGTLLSAVGDLLGTGLSASTREFVDALSPLRAYGGLIRPVFAQGAEKYERFAHMGGAPDAVYERAWFHVAVLLAWSLGSVTVGYLRFRRAELA